MAGACGLCPGLGLGVLVGLLMGSLWLGVGSFWVWGGWWVAFWCWAFTVWVLFVLLVGGGGGCVLRNKQIISVQRAPCLPRFILVGGFSDTLLVVSILDRVYDCHL